MFNIHYSSTINGSMKKIKLSQRISLAAVSASLIISPSLADVCDIEQIPISISAMNKPMPEILQQIAEQTELTINVENLDILGTNKSIELEQVPLDSTFKRLLKNVNYSVICDDKEKSLTLVLFDKSMVPASRPVASTPVETNPTVASRPSPSSQEEAFEQEMDDISSALNDYYSGQVQSPSTEDPEEMRGITSALDEFHENQASGAEPVATVKKKTSMDEMNEAIEQYNSSPAPSAQTGSTEESSPGEMAAVDNALKEYNVGQTAPQSTQSSTGQGNQSEIDKAFSDFERNNSN